MGYQSSSLADKIHANRNWVTQPSDVTIQQTGSGYITKDIKVPIFYHYNGDHYVALNKRQDSNDKNKETLRNHTVIPTGSTVAVQREDGEHCT